MPQDNLQPSPQPSQPENPVPSPEVIQPASSNVVSPSNSAPQPAVSSAITQPTPTVNGQPFRPMTPMSSSQFEQKSNQKPSKRHHLFIVLGILQAFGVAYFFLNIIMICQLPETGKDLGWAFFLFFNLISAPAVVGIALINFAGLSMYMRRHKPNGKGMIFSILSLSVSVILALYGAYTIYLFNRGVYGAPPVSICLSEASTAIRTGIRTI